MRLRRLLVAFGTAPVLFAIGPVLAFTPDSQTESLEFPLVWEASPIEFHSVKLDDSPLAPSSNLGADWTIQTHPRTGFVHMAYGGNVVLSPSVTSGAEAAQLARGFLLDQGSLLGTDFDNMELRTVNHARGKWVAHFDQVVQGVQVFRASAFVLMAESGRVTAFGSDFVPEGHDVATRPSLSEAEAIQAAANAIAATPRADRRLPRRLRVERTLRQVGQLRARSDGRDPVPAQRVSPDQRDRERRG
jgi:hypothetical protein